MNKLAKVALTVYALMAVYHELDKTKTTVYHNTHIEDAYEAPDPCGLTVVVCDGIGDVPEGKPAKSGKNMDTDHIVALIRETFPEDPETAVAIAKAESGMNPKAVNTKNRNGSSDYGLFQINSIHKPTEAQKFDAAENIKVAKRIYDARGNWTAWSAFNNQKYKQYL